MSTLTCERCSKATPHHDIIRYGDAEGSYRPWCTACVNQDVAQRIALHGFQHVDFRPVRLIDARGVEHTFHFRVRLFGNLSVEAFELVDGATGGYQFQIIDDAEADAWVLLARLIERIRRALELGHLIEGHDGPGIRDRCVRGRIDADLACERRMPLLVIDGREITWDEFGRMLMTFEGWQFKLECLDRSEEA